ncbi:hypothetical protein [Mesorhizobium sp. WSM3860]|uniref:hypothetical protein n=1 Tax=Mesorhizobium sp. WSM3860 TaxID=2029403 RepID=UPI000BAFF48F|nr:hypothetical protein [Mesorhizobium sp. WSM3860]PBC01829.1 hypothetical protein CK220_23975 [Mesorhizobium sp. WSM3860]
MPKEHTSPTQNNPGKLVSEGEARRDFLKKAGRFAAVTPPAITLLLGTSLSSKAIAKSGGSRPGNGWGDKNHVHLGSSGSGPKPKIFKSGNGKLFRSGGSRGDSYGGGAHGGSRGGDPN